MFLKYIKTSITFDLEILYGVGGAEKNSPLQRKQVHQKIMASLLVIVKN